MQINVNVDGLGNLKDNINARVLKAQRFMANQALIEMNKHIPKREGTLRSSGAIAYDGSSISWPMVYAHYQYLGVSKLGKKNWHYTTPGTGPYWDKRTMADPTAVKHITDAFKNSF